ncbi:MAG: hypothetical protein L3J45_10955, partial [Flavobacteriaceae bacterium]|nr:hypothetical protein [Flavobacteriaceae bacterium]
MKKSKFKSRLFLLIGLCAFLNLKAQNNALKAAATSSYTSTGVTSATVGTAYTYALTTNTNAANVVSATTLPSWLTLEQVSTLAGSGTAGFADGTGSAAQFSSPNGIAIDASGTMYVADYGNHRIRKITPAGVVTTLAGSGVAGFADGTGTAAQFNTPYGVAIDASGNVYVADTGNNRIRKIIVSTGAVTTLAGSGVAGFLNGIGIGAKFSGPDGVAVDALGTVYVADTGNQRIRKIIVSTGAVTTLAGSGVAGFANGTGIGAQFTNPRGIAVDASGTVYVADTDNQRIRKITVSTGAVTTLAGSSTSGFADGTGTAAQFYYPIGIVVDASGNVYIGDHQNQRIRKITAAGAVTTLAGSGTVGFANGTGSSAKFNTPHGLAIDASGTLYVADAGNNRIRKINMHDFNITGTPTTLNVGTNSVSLSLTDGNNTPVTQSFTITVASTASSYTSTAVTSATVGTAYTYALTTNANAANVVTATTLPSWLSLEQVSTLAGSDTAGFADGTGSAAQFNTPNGIAIDASGNMYVADYGNHRIRKITASGVVTTLAGSGVAGFADGTGTAAQFNTPYGVAIDASGTLYVADTGNNRI